MDHMFFCPPPNPYGLPLFWSAWKCLCGAGGTGADEEGAQRQYDLHLRGLWPAYIAPGVPGTVPVDVDGTTLWVHPT